jgi:hypothetical protein
MRDRALAGETQTQLIQKPEPQTSFTVVLVGLNERVLSESHTKPAERLWCPRQWPSGDKLHFHNI